MKRIGEWEELESMTRTTSDEPPRLTELERLTEQLPGTQSLLFLTERKIFLTVKFL